MLWAVRSNRAYYATRYLVHVAHRHHSAEWFCREPTHSQTNVCGRADGRLLIVASQIEKNEESCVEISLSSQIVTQGKLQLLSTTSTNYCCRVTSTSKQQHSSSTFSSISRIRSNNMQCQAHLSHSQCTHRVRSHFCSTPATKLTYLMGQPALVGFDARAGIVGAHRRCCEGLEGDKCTYGPDGSTCQVSNANRVHP